MLFSRKDLTKIIVPLIIEQALSVALGIADSIMVSGSGETAVSGVSLVDNINLLLVYLFSAFSVGGSIISSQLLGRGDKKYASEAAKQLFFSIFAVSAFITFTVVILRKPILSLVFGSVEEDIMKNALSYFLFTALSYPFLAIYNSGAAVFRSMGNSKLPMYVSLIMNIVNVIGNAILIFYFKMGVRGAAIATLFARFISALLMIIYVRDRNNDIYIDTFLKYKPDFYLIKNILKIGVPTGVENCIFQLGKVFTQSLVSSLGTVCVAANAVANTLNSIQSVPGNAIGFAMITVVGRCIGAKEKAQAKMYSKKLIFVTYCCAFFTSLTFITFMKPFIGIYNFSKETFDLSYWIMMSHCITFSVYWPLAFTVPTAFRASSDVKYPLVISMISMWVFRVGLSFALCRFFSMGLWGVWIAMYADWLFRAILYFIRYVRGTYLTKYVPIEKRG